MDQSKTKLQLKALLILVPVVFNLLWMLSGYLNTRHQTLQNFQSTVTAYQEQMGAGLFFSDMRLMKTMAERILAQPDIQGIRLVDEFNHETIHGGMSWLTDQFGEADITLQKSGKLISHASSTLSLKQTLYFHNEYHQLEVGTLYLYTTNSALLLGLGWHWLLLLTATLAWVGSLWLIRRQTLRQGLLLPLKKLNQQYNPDGTYNYEKALKLAELKPLPQLRKLLGHLSKEEANLRESITSMQQQYNQQLHEKEKIQLEYQASLSYSNLRQQLLEYSRQVMKDVDPFSAMLHTANAILAVLPPKAGMLMRLTFREENASGSSGYATFLMESETVGNQNASLPPSTLDLSQIKYSDQAPLDELEWEMMPMQTGYSTLAGKLMLAVWNENHLLGVLVVDRLEPKKLDIKVMEVAEILAELLHSSLLRILELQLLRQVNPNPAKDSD